MEWLWYPKSFEAIAGSVCREDVNANIERHKRKKERRYADIISISVHHG